MPDTPQPTFTQVRVAVFSKDSLRGLASVKVAEAVYLTGIRIIAGKHGLFVTMPCKKDKDGEYHDIFFCASKAKRDELTAAVLDVYQRECATAGIDPLTGEPKP